MPYNVQTQSGTTLDEIEILKKPSLECLQSAQSIVMSAAACWADALVTGVDITDPRLSTGSRLLRKGTIVAAIPGDAHSRFKVYRPVGAGGGEERVSIAVNATGGTWTATFGGQTTAAIAWNASAAAVEAALEALSTIDTVTVTGGPGNAGGTTPYIIEFIGTPAGDVGAVTTTPAALTGGAATAAVTVLQTGTAASGSEVPAGILDMDIEFLTNTDASDEPCNMLWHAGVFDKTKIREYAEHAVELSAALSTCRFI